MATESTGSDRLAGTGVQTPRAHTARGQLWLAFQRRGPVLLLAGIFILLTLAAGYHYLIYLPQPDQPHLLTLLDDVFALGVAAATGLVGLPLGRRLLRPFGLTGFSRLERGALALGAGWGLLSLAVLALGLAHLLYGWLLIAGLGLALVILWHEIWRGLVFLASGDWLPGLRLLRPQTFLEKALAGIVLLELTLLGTQMLTLPFEPQGWDVYAYHWAVPRLYLLHHAVYALPGWAHANFPFASEMLNTLALAFDIPVAAVLLQATFGVLAMLLVVWFLLRRFGRLAAWIGLALCLASPLFTTLLVSSYADLGATYYSVASVVIVLAWMEQREQLETPGNTRLLFIAGLFAGFGLGVKYTEAQVLVGTALLLVVIAIVRTLRARRQGERLWPALRLWLRGGLTYGAAVLLAVLPWLLKDFALLGNPIYPFVWGGPEWDTARAQTGVVTFDHFGAHGPLWERLPGTFFDLFFDSERVADTPSATPPNDLLLLALLAPVGLLVNHLRRRQKGLRAEVQAAKQELIWLVVAVGGFGTWVISNAAVARYAQPWVILMTVPAAVTLARLCQVRWHRPLARAAALGLRYVGPTLILSMALILGPLSSLQFWVRYDPPLLLTGQVSLHTWEKQHLFDSGYWAMVEYVNTQIPRNEKVLLVGRGTGYFLEGRDYVNDSAEDWIPYLESEGHTPAGMLALLQHDGFMYIIYEETTLQYTIHTYDNSYLPHFLPVFRQFLAGSLIETWGYQNYRIYRVPSTHR